MLDGLTYALQGLIVLGLGASTWFFVASCFGARRLLGARPTAVLARGDVHLPPVTILKPLKGLEVDLFENLSSFCRQDYPCFQLVFGVADAHDPAVQVVQRLQEHYPNVAIDLVIDPRVWGTNYKISNLENMHAASQHDVLVIADSDIRVASDYLRRIVVPLADPSVGVATCLYRAIGTGDLPSFVESLCVNTDFVPMVCIASIVETPSYVFGATMALRRSVLDEIGGFRALTNYLADDYYLGYRSTQRGYRLVLTDMVVETVLAVGTWGRLRDHQLRWARTYRSVRPWGYFASILTHGMFWAVVNLAFNAFTAWAWLVLGALAATRVLNAWIISNTYLHARLRLPQALLVPFKDLFVSAIWFLAFSGDHVHWSGHAFRVRKDGEMVDLAATAGVHLAGVPAVGRDVHDDRDPRAASL